MKYKQYLLIIPLLFNLTKATAQQKDLLDLAMDAMDESEEYVRSLEFHLRYELKLKEFLVAQIEKADELNTSVGFNHKYGFAIAIPAAMLSSGGLVYLGLKGNQGINAITPSADLRKAYKAAEHEANFLARDIKNAELDLRDVDRRTAALFRSQNTDKIGPDTEIQARLNRLSGTFPQNKINQVFVEEYYDKNDALEKLLEERRELFRANPKPGPIYKIGRFSRGASKVALGLTVFAAGVAIVGDAAIVFFPGYSDEVLADLKKDIDDLKSTLYASVPQSDLQQQQ